MHMKRIWIKFEDSGIAIAPVKLQINKNAHEEKHVQCVQSVARYIKNKNKNCHIVTLKGEAIRCYTLPKGDLGATTAKRQLLYVSRHTNSVADCSFKTYT